MQVLDTVSEQSRSYHGLQPPWFVNQYAAMPSLHLGWNVLIGIAIVRTARQPVARLFGWFMPAAMAVSIVLTANHYIIDAPAGIVVALAGLWAAARLGIHEEGAVERYAVKLGRGVRIARMLARNALSTGHVVLATLVVTRRCNLACSYCNEYDHVSSPVPLRDLLGRVDRLAELGTSIVTISGGEPLLHPELGEVVRHIRRRGMIATVITNGYPLTRSRIEALNAAGLDYLQISIDNVEPDEASRKSLSLLEAKLAALARLARFTVNVNLVVGAGVRNPEEALLVAKRASQLGFKPSIGVIHDGRGQLRPLSERERAVYRAVRRRTGVGFGLVDRFESKLAAGKPTSWRCRAGGRYLYIDEHGLVSWCSQQRGTPGLPLLRYGRDEMRREYMRAKPCAPLCTIQCVHRASLLDGWRDPQRTERVPSSEFRVPSSGSSSE
jgi:MoaA/NifB/PqqE/SkfB family radical SAM enzyme